MASEESGFLVDVEVKEDKDNTSFFFVAKWNRAKFDLRLPGSSTVGQVSKKSDSLCGSSRFSAQDTKLCGASMQQLKGSQS